PTELPRVRAPVPARGEEAPLGRRGRVPPRTGRGARGAGSSAGCREPPRRSVSEAGAHLPDRRARGGPRMSPRTLLRITEVPERPFDHATFVAGGPVSYEGTFGEMSFGYEDDTWYPLELAKPNDRLSSIALRF